MMRRLQLAPFLVTAALLFGACDKKAEPTGATNAGEEPTTAADQTAAQDAPATNNAAKPVSKFDTIADGEWCARAHSDTVKLVQAMQETMKRTGQEEDPYQVPPAEEYVPLCEKLPADMQKCLVLGYAVKNKDACQAAQDGLEGEAKAAYTELMGK